MSIRIENVEAFGFNAALRGMRNPMNSWRLSDSNWELDGEDISYKVGDNDLALMRKLYKAGTEHRKYLRMIHVQMDITANTVWWAEFDTYKVGTVRNSCSKMHRIHAKEFTEDDFSHEGIDQCGDEIQEVFQGVMTACEYLRRKFNEKQEKKYWRALIELLPEGYNLKATVDLNYETIVSICKQRKGHKMAEWKDFIAECRKMPYIEELMKR